MATPKGEGRFAALKGLRHQRIDEDAPTEDDMTTAAAKKPTKEPRGQQQPRSSKKPATATTAKRNQEPKLLKKATEPKEEKQVGAGRPRGRRSDPDYTQITAYIPQELYQNVQEELLREKRNLRTRSSKNASELIEELLDKWLTTRKSKNSKD